MARRPFLLVIPGFFFYLLYFIQPVNSPFHECSNIKPKYKGTNANRVDRIGGKLTDGNRNTNQTRYR